MEEYSLLPSIYDAALDPERWPEVMSNLGTAFDTGIGAVMFVSDAEYERTRVLGHADRGDSIRDYVANWSNHGSDKAAARSRGRSAREVGPGDIARATAGLREGDVCSDDMVIPRDVLVRSAFYNEHLVKFDFHHALGAKVWQGPSGSCVLSLSRGKRRGEFSASDMKRLGAIQTHLQRAIAMTQRLAWAEVGGAAGEAGLERVSCATLLLDQLGRCVHANAAAWTMLAGTDGIRLVKGELRARNSTANERIEAGVALAIGGDRQGRRAGQAVSVPRASGLSPLALMIAPVSTAHDWFLPQRPRALVTVVDPETRVVPTSTKVKSLFRLTESEAAVALGIGRGLELKAVAADLGLTSDSARQYLTRIYAKTETRRQNDLARLLSHIGAV